MSGSSMRKILGVLAAMALCSCSNDWSAGLADKRVLSSTGSPTSSSMGEAGAAAAALRAQGERSFANAPDKGSLVQYPKEQVIRRTGAYTWHAADLSEDHALRSTITGDLSFTAPDGTPIKLSYERHVEHPDGNWSWFGRAAGERGESTVITFGEEAVFGSIPQGRDQPPLRLTIADGRAWVVSADPRQLQEIRNAATHPTDQDFLVPPKLSVSTAASTATATGGMEAMGAEASATTASGKTVVDVLVGFTDGYSAYRGGTSAAVTRIHNLIEVTNQAYRNSQVNAEVRLVHTMQVSYPDATANKTALEELTGFKAPSTRITPAPAFSPLRAARDQYGADVVVLLRRFQDPENDGCGIAWLIGGGRSGMNASDEFFGYSVVGDGQDAGTDGKTYFCRDETLAHEIGHNMGAQHDAENAKKADGSVSYGAYSYSFGYRAAAGAGDFYTVMAYGDSGQTRNRVFSNPNVAICGLHANLVCGVAEQADNARSLNQAVPTIATFRASVVVAPVETKIALKMDANGDGRADLIWYHDGAQQVAYWLMNGVSVGQRGDRFSGGNYRVISAGDYNGDGRDDLLWLGTGGDMVMWFATGAGYSSAATVNYPTGWLLVGSTDLDADGKADLVWYHVAAQQIAYWKMNGTSIVGSGDRPSGGGYRVISIGDYNGDNRGDLLWKGPDDRMTIWFSTGSGFSNRAFVGYPRGWNLIGSPDIDGDGRTDLVWYHPGAEQIASWAMDGTNITRRGDRFSGGRYRVVALGDYNGDGRDDLLWKGVADDMVMWFSTGTGFSNLATVGYPAGWSLLVE